MKGLRTWTGLFFGIVLGLSLALAACGGNSKQEVAAQKARDEVLAKDATEQQKRFEELKKKADAEREQTQKRERAERRAEAVKSIRAAFDPAKADAPVGDQPAWVAELRRGRPQPVNEACQKLEKFAGVNWGFRAIDQQDEEGRISWLEIGLEKPQARKLHRETGLAAARSLLAVFSLPRETRRENECGRGEGTFGLDYGSRIMGEITRILLGIEAEPKAIDSSPAVLRQVLLKDLREQIAYLRSEIKAGRAKASDGGANAVRFVAEEATRHWNFTEKELGLTTEEVAMLHKKEE